MISAKLKYLCVGLIAPLTMALTLGKVEAQSRSIAPSNHPDSLVRSLYEQVVARNPVGIPDRKIFDPYLSKSLRHRFDLAKACFADWRRQNPDSNLKPPEVLIEDGLFSGDSEEAEPKAFHIEKTESKKDGSFRVFVRLIWEDPTNKPLIWYVAVVVIPDGGHLAVNDVLYLKNKAGVAESTLLQKLASQCLSGRWVGNSARPH